MFAVERSTEDIDEEGILSNRCILKKPGSIDACSDLTSHCRKCTQIPTLGVKCSFFIFPLLSRVRKNSCVLLFPEVGPWHDCPLLAGGHDARSGYPASRAVQLSLAGGARTCDAPAAAYPAVRGHGPDCV